MKAHEFRHEMTTTSGIFGRHKEVEVVFQGENAATDGKTIYLPALPDDVELTTQQVQAMRGYVDHEAGHLRHSNVPLIVSNYKTWEKNNHQGLRQLHNYLEDVWMEARVIDDYTGAEKNLKAVTEMVNEKELVWAEENKEHLQGFNVDSIGMSIALEGRKNYSGDNNHKLTEYMPENVKEFAKKFVSEVHKCRDSEEVTNLAKAIYELLEKDPKGESKPEEFDPNDFDPKTGGEGDDEAQENQIPMNVQKGDKESKQVVEANEVLEGKIPGGIGYPEGDYVGSYRVLSTKGDEVYSLKNPGGVEAFKSTNVIPYLDTKSKIKSHVATMKQRLRVALLSKQRRDWDFGRETGKLDSKRLVSAYNRNLNVFKNRTERDEENTAIQILVDLSGSMSGSKVQLAQECAIAIAECFEGTSLAYQISGFDAEQNDKDYYKNIEKVKGSFHRADNNLIYNFKPFDLPLRQARPALGMMTETGQQNNADRDAIIWCLNTLKQRDEKRKILLVLSDGHPANVTINVSYRELTRHAKLAVEWGTKQGIECIGIGIMDSTVELIYPKAVVVRNINELSTTAFSQFTNLLLKGK